MKHILEVSIYTSNGKERPRLTILNGNFGTRIYGGKFNDFDIEKSFDIPLDEKLIDEMIKELNKVKDMLSKEKAND